MVLVALSVTIAVLAVMTLVQVEAAAAAADTLAGPRRGIPQLADDQLAQRRLLVHVTSLRRFASGALFSAGLVLAAALLMRRARAASRVAAQG